MKFGKNSEIGFLDWNRSLACMSLDNTTRRDALKFLGVGTAITTFGTGSAMAGGHGGGPGSSEDGPVKEVKSMVGNTLTGDVGTIRGIGAGGLPWVIDEAEVKLDADGKLKVEVEGLVIADDSSVPEDLRGVNPIENFRAILSCLVPNEDENEHTMTNVQTGTFPATDDGDSEIEETIEVPQPCLAPIVFVTSPGGSWFAVTGF